MKLECAWWTWHPCRAVFVVSRGTEVVFSSFSALVEGWALLAYRLLARLAEGWEWDDEYQSKLPSLDWNVISGIPYTGSVCPRLPFHTRLCQASVSSLISVSSSLLFKNTIQSLRLWSDRNNIPNKLPFYCDHTIKRERWNTIYGVLMIWSIVSSGRAGSCGIKVRKNEMHG